MPAPGFSGIAHVWCSHPTSFIALGGWVVGAGHDSSHQIKVSLQEDVHDEALRMGLCGSLVRA